MGLTTRYETVLQTRILLTTLTARLCTIQCGRLRWVKDQAHCSGTRAHTLHNATCGTISRASARLSIKSRGRRRHYDRSTHQPCARLATCLWLRSWMNLCLRISTTWGRGSTGCRTSSGCGCGCGTSISIPPGCWRIKGRQFHQLRLVCRCRCRAKVRVSRLSSSGSAPPQAL